MPPRVSKVYSYRRSRDQLRKNRNIIWAINRKNMGEIFNSTAVGLSESGYQGVELLALRRERGDLKVRCMSRMKN